MFAWASPAAGRRELLLVRQVCLFAMVCNVLYSTPIDVCTSIYELLRYDVLLLEGVSLNDFLINLEVL